MKKKAGYQSVSQMARRMTEGDFADEFDKRIRRRKIVKDLMVLRARRGLSQGAVAQKMGAPKAASRSSNPPRIRISAWGTLLVTQVPSDSDWVW
jgi:hypothetical protein